MVPDFVPLRAIVFQFLCLLVTIALESWVFYRTLTLDYKTSVQYSTSLNLCSTVLGWIFFFNLQSLLPPELRLQLISYVFFGQFFTNPWLTRVAPIIVLTGLATFLGTFLVEIQGLEALEKVLEQKIDVQPEVIEQKRTLFQRANRSLLGDQTNRKAFALLIANACSYSANLVLLLALHAVG